MSATGLPPLALPRRGAGRRVRTQDGPQTPERIPLLSRPLASYYLLLSAAGLLLVFGLVMVLSASSVTAYAEYKSSYYYFIRQAMWIAMGLPVFFIASRLSIRAFRWLAYPVLVVSFVLLLAVMVPGDRRHRQRFDPLGRRRSVRDPAERVRQARHRAVGGGPAGAQVPPARGVAPPARAAGAGRHAVRGDRDDAAGHGHDIGDRHPAAGPAVDRRRAWAACSPASSPWSPALATFLAVLEPYRLARLTSFRDPFNDAMGSGYQAVQGIYALSSGGWWGLGLGASREKWSYLPNAHTDFILAIIGEELGLIGTLMVVALFESSRTPGSGSRPGRRTRSSGWLPRR